MMTAQAVKGYLKELRDHPVESLWIYGGEPFLYIGVLTEVVKIAKSWRIPRIGVLTNGYWATKPNADLLKLSQLKKAGLNAIIISTDGFHCEKVSPQLAMSAAQVALKVGLEKVTFSVAFVPPRKVSNPFNDRSEEIWSQLGEISGVALDENPVTIIGRAGEELLEYCQLQQMRSPKRCQPPSYIGGSFDQPEGLEIDPHGWVMICPGLSLGNAQAKSLATMVAQYGSSKNFLWQVFFQEGPAGLAELAQDKGYVRRERYASVCHLCYEARKFLQPHYSEQLAPIDCYQELSRKGRKLR